MLYSMSFLLYFGHLYVSEGWQLLEDPKQYKTMSNGMADFYANSLFGSKVSSGVRTIHKFDFCSHYSHITSHLV